MRALKGKKVVEGRNSSIEKTIRLDPTTHHLTFDLREALMQLSVIWYSTQKILFIILLWSTISIHSLFVSNLRDPWIFFFRHDSFYM
jgi:hypothetical protein